MFLTSLYHNPIHDWLFALGLTLVVFVAVLLVKSIGHRKLAALAVRSTTSWDDLLVVLIDRLHGFFLFTAAVYFGSLKLSIPVAVRVILDHGVVIILLVQIAVLCSAAVTFWVDQFRRRRMATDAAAVTTLISVGFVLHLVIWIVLVLIGLDNLGIDITALVAGLGITGIAVALAMQNILGDLFASFSIVLDKPFVIGDFIALDSYMGTVEHIGLKTTRLRSLTGEQLIIANADLLKSRIRNYQRMQERRVVFTVRAAYHTPLERLREIPKILRLAVARHAEARLERAHFAEYTVLALRFEVVYWLTTSDYTRYMDVQQAINLEIFEKFQQAGIEFAHPAHVPPASKDSSS